MLRMIFISIIMWFSQHAMAEQSPPAVVSLSADGPATIEVFADLVAKQQWETAQVIADELRAEWQGTALFDLYYGQLLIHNADYENAIMAFKRVLQTTPEQMRARTELGRSYFYMQDFQRAHYELDQVLFARPSDEMRNEVNKLLKEIKRAEQRFEISNTLAISFTVGWADKANPLGLTDLANYSAADGTGYARWAVNYALVEPINEHSSRQLLAEYAYQQYPDGVLKNTHSVTLGSFVDYQNQRLRTQWPISIGSIWTQQALSAVNLTSSLQWQTNFWGPLWVGPALTTSTRFFTDDNLYLNAANSAGLALSATEQARAHRIAFGYVNFLQAGHAVENFEWQGFSTNYQLTWPINNTFSWQQEMEHQWRNYARNRQTDTTNQSSAELPVRTDQNIDISSTIRWAPTSWLQSESKFNFEWLESNMDEASQNQWNVSQTFRLTL